MKNICDPYDCVLRNIVNNLKATMVKKKFEGIWLYETDHVSKDTLPESALSYYKKKYENHNPKNNERNKS